MARTRTPKGRGSSLSDHAAVRGVRKGRANKRKVDRKQVLLQTLRKVAIGGVTMAALVGAIYGSYRAWGWAKTTERFAAETIIVQGAKRASAETVQRLSGIRQGDNLFEMDVAPAVEAVAAHPWVARVEIDKRYPHKVIIRVTEHEPVVLVALGHLYYANAAGEIVKRYAPGEQEDLPVLTGLSRAQIEDDDPQEKARLREGIRFLQAWSAAGAGDASDIVEVHLDPVMGVSFVQRRSDARVVVGHAPWVEKIERLATVLGTLEARGVRASQITLSGTRRPERVVARLSPRGGVGASRGKTAGVHAPASAAQKLAATAEVSGSAGEGR